jgi:hypothetical protein
MSAELTQDGKLARTSADGGVALLLFAVSVSLSLWLGTRALLERDLVNWSAMSAVSHAYDVFHKEPQANLSLIGFVEPPFPALVQLPFAAFVPQACVSGLSAGIVGSLALGLAVLALYALGRSLRLPIWARAIICLCLALHPLALSLAASGAPAILLIWALTGALAALARWARSDAFRDLLTAALYLSAAVLTRFEAAFVVLAISAYIAWHSIRRAEGSYRRAEGTLLAFLMPVLYAAGIWIATNWAIMGDPWHFLHYAFSDASGSQAAETTDMWFSVLLAVTLACSFPVFALLYYEVRGTGGDPRAGRCIAWAFVGMLVVAAALPGLFGALPGATSWDKLITLVALCIAAGPVLLATVAGQYVKNASLPALDAGHVGARFIAPSLDTARQTPVTPQGAVNRAPTPPSAGSGAEAAVLPLSPGAKRRRERGRDSKSLRSGGEDAVLPSPQAARSDAGRGAGGEAKRPLAGFVLLLVLSAVLSYHLRLTGAGLPVSFRALPTGQIGMTDSCSGEREAARLLAQAPPTTRAVIAGWPGFAVSLFAVRSAGVIVENEPQGNPADVLYRDNLLILRYGEGPGPGGKSLRAFWQSRQPAYLHLEHQYRAGTWDIYKAVVVPVVPTP